MEFTQREVMAAAAAMELKDGEVVVSGLGLPQVSTQLAKLTHGPKITQVIEIGVIDAKTLARQRKYAILLIFIFAAMVTPPDVISQVIMALPLIALYELSILLSRVFGKRPASPAPNATQGV